MSILKIKANALSAALGLAYSVDSAAENVLVFVAACALAVRDVFRDSLASTVDKLEEAEYRAGEALHVQAIEKAVAAAEAAERRRMAALNVLFGCVAAVEEAELDLIFAEDDLAFYQGREPHFSSAPDEDFSANDLFILSLLPASVFDINEVEVESDDFDGFADMTPATAALYELTPSIASEDYRINKDAE